MAAPFAFSLFDPTLIFVINCALVPALKARDPAVVAEYATDPLFLAGHHSTHSGSRPVCAKRAASAARAVGKSSRQLVPVERQRFSFAAGLGRWYTEGEDIVVYSSVHVCQPRI